MAEPRKVIKKWVVDTAKHHAWGDESEVKVSVDPKDGGFWIWCSIVGEVKGHSKEDCIQAWHSLYAQARAPETKWEQIIVVKRVDTDQFRDDGQMGMYIGFEQITRIERAIVSTPLVDWLGRPAKDRKVKLYRAFGASETQDDPTTAENTYKGFNVHYDRDKVPLYGAQILPYNEATWQTLMAMKDALRQMNSRVNDMFMGNGADVAARLAAVPSNRLLTGGVSDGPE